MIVNKFVPSQEIFNNISNIKEKGNEAANKSFESVLKDNLDKLNQKQIEADNITNEFIAGGDVEVHEMMLSMEEAKMSLQLAIQVRNKVVDAIKELNNMQL
ncbi:flagellar hook-basal body complex protein FliE [Caproiciproducens sp. MSJ-32]|uniref:flagellar hook-basal body complex protein FliE n=1 Tax=Caproiciproducens sp. MSJ-32 TaxID=2841527 RepID=UPI001C113C5C|nr:flagellar hook-basal body complex protein FliE [Caproiciproducens sp. MSJ-32]